MSDKYEVALIAAGDVMKAAGFDSVCITARTRRVRCRHYHIGTREELITMLEYHKLLLLMDMLIADIVPGQTNTPRYPNLGDIMAGKEQQS